MLLSCKGVLRETLTNYKVYIYIHFTLHDIYTLYFTCSLYIYTLRYMIYIHFTLHDDKKNNKYPENCTEKCVNFC